MDLMRIVISFPGVFILFLLLFRNDLKSMFSKLKSLWTAHFGVELQAPDTENRMSLGDALSNKNLEQIRKEFENFNEVLYEKEELLKAAVDKIKNKEDFINFLITRLNFFEFLYLNKFYVPRTKQVLNLISKHESINREFINRHFRNISNDELATILKVLEDHFLIREQDNVIKINPRGERFLEFIGFKQNDKVFYDSNS